MEAIRADSENGWHYKLYYKVISLNAISEFPLNNLIGFPRGAYSICGIGACA